MARIILTALGLLLAAELSFAAPNIVNMKIEDQPGTAENCGMSSVLKCLLNLMVTAWSPNIVRCGI